MSLLTDNEKNNSNQYETDKLLDRCSLCKIMFDMR